MQIVAVYPQEAGASSCGNVTSEAYKELWRQAQQELVIADAGKMQEHTLEPVQQLLVCLVKAVLQCF